MSSEAIQRATGAYTRMPARDRFEESVIRQARRGVEICHCAGGARRSSVGAALPAAAFLVFLAGATPAFANMPVAFVFAWLPITALGMTIVGALIEAVAVWRFLGLSWYRALAAVIIANVVSIVVGVILIPQIGVPIELGLRTMLADAEQQTQILVGFAIAQMLLPAVNTAIELPVLVMFGVRWRWRSAAIIYAANLVTVALLIWPLIIGDIQIGAPPAEPAPEVKIEGSARDLGADCAGCPEMVSIPGGRFTMGSPKSEQDRPTRQTPLHWVNIRPFTLGKYEVTWDEWELCVSEGACKGKFEVSRIEWELCVSAGLCKGDDRRMVRSDEGWGKGRRPVINVSWRDAQDYVRWLSKKTGKNYRLPSEAEWEYAARAGTTTRFSWGDQDPVCDPAAPNGAQFNDCNIQGTRPVGSFRPNGFGLHDMHGNVMEWMADCYHESYKGAPEDGSAWRDLGGGCGSLALPGPRVVRGGLGAHSPGPSALRTRSYPDLRSDDQGIRVARDL